ncbi:ATPase [Rossellomorea vietnamensis]|uniref:ATPase n=1 Tax=Rossellomorea vietnamensis TaxID=218284 RepID=A0A5D4KJA0_9BACI|nr:SRPBCC family protein [Rossellomorea vietnamensis]TYR76959.1 ATPase [Rossellomorea vietnamensis]
MINVVTETMIEAPISKVAAYASDPENAPQWYSNISSAEWVTPKPLQLGSQIAFKAEFLGRQLAYTYEIVELIPEEKLVMKTAQGPFPMETTYSWRAINERQTMMSLQNKGEPSGFSKLFAPFMAPMMKKENKKDLAKIKLILEGI